MNLLRHWPERIVAVTDGEGELGALIEYRKLEADERPEASDVEYVRSDLHRGGVSREAAQRFRDALAPGLIVWHDGKRLSPEDTLTQIERGLHAAWGR